MRKDPGYPARGAYYAEGFELSTEFWVLYPNHSAYPPAAGSYAETSSLLIVMWSTAHLINR